MGYLERERNYLPWKIARASFKIILDLLKPSSTDSADREEREEVYDRFKTWVISLIMPYFYENGYKDASDATEEQKLLKSEMIQFACNKPILHEPCLRFDRQQPRQPLKLLSDEEYCVQMLPKIVHQFDITADVSLNVLERCPEQVMSSPKKEDFMSKLASKVETRKELERLKEWEKKHRSLPCPPGTQCYLGNSLKWAQNSINKVDIRLKAREKCRDMVFQTLKKVFT